MIKRGSCNKGLRSTPFAGNKGTPEKGLTLDSEILDKKMQ